MHRSRLLAPVVGALILAGTVSTQSPASYAVYGRGCAGTGQGGAVCASINAGATAANMRTGTLPNEYCYGFTAPTGGLTVIGLSLFTLTPGTTDVVMKCGLYMGTTATGTTPAATQTAHGEMIVSQTAAWYTGFFDRPITIPATSTFWVSQYDTTNVLAAAQTTGTAPTLPVYWRRTGYGWTSTVIISYPAVKVICVGNTTPNAEPILTHTGVPKLGGSFSVDLHQATPVAGVANLLLGFSRTTGFGGLGLPFDLKPLGAAGCRIYASGELMILGNAISSTGSASLKLGVPNMTSLNGLKLYNQWFFNDPLVKGRGWTISVSNGGEGTIGT